ncbi:hypothetical protein MYAM1_001532 [Malassezia yamatoensis]|uniref:Uncharacterized protein n=1 Tax=Malassezia yamatoensis TaxID=253288 RepID=A0AAJ6CH07_9BASI|nr:hypothetical protein MYAM1_001532 [Malassezia yamatoensis]
MPGVIQRVLETGVLLLCILDVHHALRYAHVPRRSAERAPNDWARSAVLTSGGEARRLGSARRRTRLRGTLQTLCVWFVYIGIFPMVEGILGWIIPFWSTIQTLWLLWMLANRRMPIVSRHELHIDEATRWVHGFLLFSMNIIGSPRICPRLGSIRAWEQKETTEQDQMDSSVTQHSPGLEKGDDTVAGTNFLVASQPNTLEDRPQKEEFSVRQEKQKKRNEHSDKPIQTPASSIYSRTATSSHLTTDARNIEAQNFDASQCKASSLASTVCLGQPNNPSRTPEISTSQSKTSETSLRDSLISRAERRSKRETVSSNGSTAPSFSPSPPQLRTSTLISKDCSPLLSISQENPHAHGSTDEFVPPHALLQRADLDNLGRSKHKDLTPSATPAKRSPFEPKAERNVRSRRNLSQTQTDTVGSAKRVIHTMRTATTSQSGSDRGPKTQRKPATSERRAASQTSLLPRPSRIPPTETETRLRRSVRTRSTTKHTVIR